MGDPFDELVLSVALPWRKQEIAFVLKPGSVSFFCFSDSTFLFPLILFKPRASCPSSLRDCLSPAFPPSVGSARQNTPMTFSMAIEVTASFADSFFELLASQQYVQLGRMFLVDPTLEHYSTVTFVDEMRGLNVFHGSEICSALTNIFSSIARKNVVIEDVAATAVSAGISGTVSFSSESLAGHVCVLLEHCDDETYFVRSMFVRVSAVAPTKQIDSVSNEVPAIPDVVAVEEPEVAVVAAVERPTPVVSPPAKGKGKAKKQAPKAAAVEQPVELPVEQPVAEEVEAQPVVDEPVAEVAPYVAPPPEVVAPTPPAPTGPKSWATLARKPAGPPGNAAPVVVRPPSAAAAAAEPVAPVAPVREVKETTKEARPPKPEIKDRLMFTIAMEVTDDEVKAALGPIARFVVSLRNQSKNNRVFVDFSTDTAFDTLTTTPMKIREFTVKIQRQHIKA